MSKNFELLHNLSNEKELFQTLETWEDITETADDAEPDSEERADQHEKTAWRSSLPDVFQAVNETLEPLSPSAPDFIRSSKASEEPVEKETGEHGETPSRTFEDRFPISRNPITPLNSISATPGWTELEAGPERGSEMGTEFRASELDGIPLPEVLQNARRTGGSDRGTIQEPPPSREEKVHQQVQTPESPSLRPPATASWDKKKSSAESAGRRVQARQVYKDAKRELIAREEEFKLVQRVFLSEEQDSPRIALFSGVEHEGGSASICVRAGELLAAQEAGNVCIVDADFRSPLLHKYFGVQNDKGLAEAALESGPIQDFAQQLSPANLWLIPGGYGASQLNLAKAADRLRARMEELREAYRYVLVHSGPLWLNANAMLLGKWTDGVVLILEANSTRRDTARRIKESLAVAKAKVLGVVLNNRSYPIPESLYSRL